MQRYHAGFASSVLRTQSIAFAKRFGGLLSWWSSTFAVVVQFTSVLLVDFNDPSVDQVINSPSVLVPAAEQSLNGATVDVYKMSLVASFLRR